MTPNSSLDEPSLTVYAPRPPRRDYCRLCDRLFDNYRSAQICSLCEEDIRGRAYNDFPMLSTPRSSSSDFYTTSPGRSYVSVPSPRSKPSYSSRIICPHCKAPNLSSNMLNDRDFRCSACLRQITSAYLY